jgi:hypothetical protein
MLAWQTHDHFGIRDGRLFPVYELAPRVHWIPAVSNQRVAGLLMWTAGSLIFVAGMAVLFFRWAQEEQAYGKGD